MLTKRIIPCLDIKDGRAVKGVNFLSLRDAGDPVELAINYAAQGADELVFLDISATEQRRKTLAKLVEDIAARCYIPFTVGGGIATPEDVSPLLDSGADKVSINSAALADPKRIETLAKSYGSQCIVLAIDARVEEGEWIVYSHGGKVKTEKELFSWAKQGAELGAGEILFTSMDHDGTKSGFAIEALSRLHSDLDIPIIASGGAGTIDHFVDVFTKTNVDAALAASVFHYGEIRIPELKKALHAQHIPIRMEELTQQQ